MDVPNAHDYPGTSIPVNFFNIRDLKSLEEKERPLSTARALELRMSGEIGDFSLAHFKKIHKQLFQDVYPWAGQERDVLTTKGKNLFDPAGTFELTFSAVQDRLAKQDFLQGLPKEEFAKEMAQAYMRINQAHPFLEGNGRTTREYMSQLASVAGYVLEYQKVDAETWNRAAKDSFENKLEGMTKVFENISSVSRAWVFDNYTRERAEKTCPELKGSFNLIDAIKASLTRKDSTQTPEGVMKVFAASRQKISAGLHEGKLPGQAIFQKQGVGPPKQVPKIQTPSVTFGKRLF